MSTYAIGDIQGCYESLQELLDIIDFDDTQDHLWFAGDLVNRGPNSLSVLRLIKSLSTVSKIVLGNHDLHLLAVAAGVQSLHAGDTLDDILSAEDSRELLDWLRLQPLLHYDETHHAVMTHAGLYPWWSIAQAKKFAAEIETTLASDRYVDLLREMYGNKPSCWSENLTGIERYRFIINAFTRMRFCDTNGHLDLIEAGEPGTQKPGLLPWFQQGVLTKDRIIFGHWAALKGKVDQSNLIALDTGCVWGGPLRAYCLESGIYFHTRRKHDNRNHR